MGLEMESEREERRERRRPVRPCERARAQRPSVRPSFPFPHFPDQPAPSTCLAASPPPPRWQCVQFSVALPVWALTPQLKDKTKYGSDRNQGTARWTAAVMVWSLLELAIMMPASHLCPSIQALRSSNPYLVLPSLSLSSLQYSTVIPADPWHSIPSVYYYPLNLCV